jgi:hypothetical protein
MNWKARGKKRSRPTLKYLQPTAEFYVKIWFILHYYSVEECNMVQFKDTRALPNTGIHLTNEREERGGKDDGGRDDDNCLFFCPFKIL